MTEGIRHPNRSDEINELIAALAKAQGAFTECKKSKTVTIKTKERATYSFDYAPLDAIIACSRPALSINELALVQTVAERDSRTELTTTLYHSSGQWLASILPLVPTADSKIFASNLTYMKRYAMSALLVIAADDDDDDGQGGKMDNRGSEVPKRQKRQARAPEQRKAKSEQSPASDEPDLYPKDGAVEMQNFLKQVAPAFNKLPTDARTVLLDTFGVAQIGDVPPERRVEFTAAVLGDNGPTEPDEGSESDPAESPPTATGVEKQQPIAYSRADLKKEIPALEGKLGLGMSMIETGRKTYAGDADLAKCEDQPLGSYMLWLKSELDKRQ